DGDRTLAYSADSAPCDGLVELARDADLFLCEATLAQPAAGIRGHLTADEALEAHTASGARRFVVIHRPDELPLPDGVERAYDGLELGVSEGWGARCSSQGCDGRREARTQGAPIAVSYRRDRGRRSRRSRPTSEARSRSAQRSPAARP